MLTAKEDTFFPVRPTIKKDKEVMNKLYGIKSSPLKLIDK
jgi:hypothetical protein